jgi:hypothetical protein
MRRTLTLVSVFTLLLGMLAIPAAAVVPEQGTASTPISETQGVTPYILPDGTGGNQGCADVGLAYFGEEDYYGYSTARINYTGGTFDADFPGGLIVVTDGTFVSFTSTFGIGAAIVKGSAAANTYVYEPQVLEDSGLAAPPNASGEPAGLSNLTFCWNKEPFVPNGELNVMKTADTSYIREHFWDIDKSVDTENGYEHEELPKIWLYTDGRGDETATWTVDVTYEGYKDYDGKVTGEITINLGGNLDAYIKTVSDYIESSADIAATVGECLLDTDQAETLVTFPYLMKQGSPDIVCKYSANAPIADGTNFANVAGEFRLPEGVTATYEPEPFNEQATAAVVFGDPTTEVNKTVNVKDLSDLFGEVALGTVTAPTGATFTDTKDFAYEDFEECGDYTYDNTASIVETGQSASATLKVNVQCMIFKGETVTGAGLPWVDVKGAPSNWFEYTPVDEYPFTADLIQGAPRNLVGEVTITKSADGKTAELCFDLGEFPEGTQWMLDDSMEYNVKIQPLAKKPTKYLQPGQFSQKFTETGSEFCVTVPYGAYGYAIHLDAGYWMPDPNFGPM